METSNKAVVTSDKDVMSLLHIRNELSVWLNDIYYHIARKAICKTS